MQRPLPTFDPLITELPTLIYKLNIKIWNSSNMPQTFIKNQVIFGQPPTAKILEDHLKKEFNLK